MRSFFSILLLLSLHLRVADASEDATRILDGNESGILENSEEVILNPEDRYLRTLSVLQHFSVPAETPQPDILARYNQAQSAAGAAKILAILDPSKRFSEYFDADGVSLHAFLDAGVKRVSDFHVAFAASDSNLRSTGLMDRLRRAARNNPRERPLQGLKIALDPGHMGGDVWDTRTGKMVKDGQGNKISEGLINLQTCLLLEKSLTDLGAQVTITHRTLAPVATIPYEKLSIEDYGKLELRSESLEPWFLALLKTGSGASLMAAFENSPQKKKIFSELERINYFMFRADIDARVAAINSATPDITLIVHYDTASGTDHVGVRPLDGTKAYVVGSFMPGEFATQRLRTQLAKKMVDSEGWNASLLLNRLVVNQLKQDLNVPFSKSGGGSSFAVEPGVFARNLGIPSHLDGQAVSYVEVLCYDDPEEFRLMRDFKHSMQIGGVAYPYSDRLVTSSSAISKAVENFVASFR